MVQSAPTFQTVTDLLEYVLFTSKGFLELLDLLLLLVHPASVVLDGVESLSSVVLVLISLASIYCPQHFGRCVPPATTS